MILVTGANGQLGTCFRNLAQAIGPERFLFADSKTLDITDLTAVQYFFDQNPTLAWCINCAAYTAVDRAETDVEAAYRVNETGAQNLAQACAKAGIPLVHYSTDYVYHGTKQTPYHETDPTSAKGVYAQSKLAGEAAILKAHPSGSMIIRTSWVYAQHGANFVNSMRRLGAERPALNVVYDQTGTPTYAPDLAAATLSIIEKIEKDHSLRTIMPGIWHYSNEGVTTWYDFAVTIMQMAGLPCKVSPIESHQYPTPAQRPAYSVMSKQKIKEVFGLEVPHWLDGLRRCLVGQQ
jgi:dTDP-4-dehydrorhamnose reductase